MKSTSKKTLALTLLSTLLLGCGGSGSESGGQTGEGNQSANQGGGSEQPPSSNGEIYEISADNDILRRSQYVTNGSVVIGSFLQEGDTDAYRLTLPRGLTVTLDVALDVGHTIELISDKYGVLNEPSSSKSITFNTELAGTYYIVISGEDHGDYEISISSVEYSLPAVVTYFQVRPDDGWCMELTEEQKQVDGPSFHLGTCLDDSGLVFNGSCSGRINAPEVYLSDWDSSNCPLKLPKN